MAADIAAQSGYRLGVTFELVIMRHAKSSWESGALTDWHRPLTSRGERDAVLMARWLAETGATPDRILSSDAVRAASTVRIVADTLGLGHGLIDFRRDLYNTNTQNWLSHLQRVAEGRQSAGQRLLICGHNPTIDSLANVLSTESLQPTDEGKYLTTASAVRLRFDGPIGRSAGQLIAMMRPTELPGFAG